MIQRPWACNVTYREHESGPSMILGHLLEHRIQAAGLVREMQAAKGRSEGRTQFATATERRLLSGDLFHVISRKAQ